MMTKEERSDYNRTYATRRKANGGKQLGWPDHHPQAKETGFPPDEFRRRFMVPGPIHAGGCGE